MPLCPACNQILTNFAFSYFLDDTISFLLNQALRRVAPIPYNFLVDKWRWRVYEGNITENAYNREWWKLRVRYQGVEPPVTRPESSFDPASKYHIGANSPYIRWYSFNVTTIVQELSFISHFMKIPASPKKKTYFLTILCLHFKFKQWFLLSLTFSYSLSTFSLSYFVSYVLQFQLHKAFCKEAGFDGPLHTCSIYKSEAAGKKLR